MPILEQPKPEDEPTFYGALCVDLSPVDVLSEYFPTREEARSRSIIFNTDEIYSAATRPFYILGNDMIPDSFRNRNLKESSFFENVDREINALSSLEDFGYKVAIKDIEIEADKALLFNEEYIISGKL